MNKKSIFAVCAIFTLVGYCQWTKSPTYTLMQLAAAIRNHDREEVDKYLDVESVAAGAIDQFFAQMAQDQKSNSRLVAAGQAKARGFLEMIKPRLALMAKVKFMEYVETGKFKEGSNETGPVANLISTLKSATGSDVEFRDVISVKKDGKIALVIIKLVSADKRETFPEIRMRDKGGHWQIIGVSNLISILQRNSPDNHSSIDGTKVSIPTFQAWVTSLKSESELYKLDFDKVYQRGRELDFTGTIRNRWIEQCKMDSDYSCRLISYFFDADGDSKKAIVALRLGCSSGKDMRSCMGLLAHKNIPKKSRAEANKIILDGCSKRDPLACQFAGSNATDAKKFDQALSYYDESCKAGRVEGCSLLAYTLFEQGKKEEAAALSSKICAGGYAYGCFQFGYIKAEAKDTRTASEYYKKGCDGGNGGSCTAWGGIEYDAGNIPEAIGAWVQSCNLLEGRGCYFIGQTLLEQNDDNDQAKEMFVKGCTLGDLDSCNKIGMRKPAWL